MKQVNTSYKMNEITKEFSLAGDEWNSKGVFISRR